MCRCTAREGQVVKCLFWAAASPLVAKLGSWIAPMMLLWGGPDVGPSPRRMNLLVYLC